MAINPNRSNLDFNQIFQRAFDEPNDRIRVDAEVTATIGTTEVIISHLNDSIRLGDGTDFLTSTTVGSDVGLDVNLIGGTVSGTFTSSGLQTAGKVTEVTLDSVTWTALPPTPLVNRNAIRIQNVGGVQLKLNYSSGIVGYVGMVLSDGNEVFYDITDTIIIYAKASSGTPTINVEELS